MSREHIVAVIGAGVAGSEAAFQFAQRGIRVVLFESNALPYGKIEEGLPKWHVKLRNQEEGKIDKKLTHPNICFVPKTMIGREVEFSDLLTWGFSAVLLAIGAGKDRPFPVEEIDDYVGKGLCYQNPFVAWFNHNHQPDYAGLQCQIHDGAVIIGGGLASLDIAKILMLETTRKALREKSVRVNLFELERLGIPAILRENKLNFSDLGLKGCTLFYRRRIGDMPLALMPPEPTEERKAKVFQLRERIFNNFREKYIFRVKTEAAPVEKIVEDGRLVGLIFQKMQVNDTSFTAIPGSNFEIRSPLFISSIGSIPTSLPGMDQQGDYFSVEDTETGRIKGFTDVFVLGNAVTGRGNIRESQQHGRKIATLVADNFLNWEVQEHQNLLHQADEDSREKVEKISKILEQKKGIPQIQRKTLEIKIAALQNVAGYKGNYHQWIKAHLPVRLEKLLGNSGSS